MNEIEQSIAYAHDRHETFLEQFKEFLRFPTVSADPAYRADIQRAADWLVTEMQRIGLRHCQALRGEGHPLVYGDWLDAGPEKITLLVYAHYDVQPVDPLDLWETPPFEPSVRDGRLYARGAIDDKAGVHVNLKAVESILAATGKLPVNVKLIFEGEEESGSPSMYALIKRHQHLLKADLLIVSDAGSMGDQPYIISSARGIVSAEVRVKGPVHDLHSGSYGGVVHNPAHMVAKMVAAVHDADGRVQIPGFYDQVKPLSEAELAYLNTIEDGTVEEAQRDSGLDAFWGVPGYTFQQRQTALPTFDVNGLAGGYKGAGGKTIIPAEASFKASMRLVFDQDPDDIAEKFTAFIQSFACPTLKIDVQITSRSRPFQALFDEPPVQMIHRAYEATYGRRAIVYRQGGSVPIMGMLQNELGIPIANLGHGNGDNGHAPNEFIGLKYYRQDIDTAIHFFHYMAELE